MRAVALKDFPYAVDGVQIVQIAAGQEFDCDPGSAPGMAEAGMIEIPVEGGPATGKGENDNPDGQDGNPEGPDGEPDGVGTETAQGEDGTPDPVAAAKAAEEAAAPRHPKAARKPAAK